MPLVTYSALRLGLLAACFALGYWAGLRTWLLLLVATFAALGLSYVLLGGPRERAATYLAERAEQRRAGVRRFPAGAESDAAHEDAVVDAERSDAAAHGQGARQTPVAPSSAADPVARRAAETTDADGEPGRA